jgi:hypothetical protein
MKIALVQGINEALVDAGAIQWPNAKVAFEACCEIASNLSGPEVLTGPLNREDAAVIAHELQKVAAALIEAGFEPSIEEINRVKMAATMDLNDRFAMLAEAAMSKVADEQLSPSAYMMSPGETRMRITNTVGEEMPVTPTGRSQRVMNLNKQANTAANAVTNALNEAAAHAQINEALAKGDPGRLGAAWLRLKGGLGDAAAYIGEKATAPVLPKTREAWGQGAKTVAKALGSDIYHDPRARAAALAGAIYGGKKLYNKFRSSREGTPESPNN